jgi:hypothetical protein
LEEGKMMLLVLVMKKMKELEVFAWEHGMVLGLVIALKRGSVSGNQIQLNLSQTYDTDRLTLEQREAISTVDSSFICNLGVNTIYAKLPLDGDPYNIFGIVKSAVKVEKAKEQLLSSDNRIVVDIFAIRGKRKDKSLISQLRVDLQRFFEKNIEGQYLEQK